MPPELSALLAPAAGEAVGRHPLGLQGRESFADAVHDCVVRTFLWWKGQGRVVEPGELRAVAFGVAKNMQAERFREAAQRNRADERHTQHAIDLAHAAAEREESVGAASSLTNAIISSIRGRMPTLHYRLLVRRVLHGWSFARIAEVDAIPASTVQRRFREAIQIVLESLRERAATDPALRAELDRICRRRDEPEGD